MLDINFSDREVSLEYKDALMDTYHCEGAEAPEDMQGFRQHKVTRQTRRISLPTKVTL